MIEQHTIRNASLTDAYSISRVIIQAVRETNAKDYESSIIEEVASSFTPDRIVRLIKERQVFVAIEHDTIIGTASLENKTIRSVFVLPNKQHQGVGISLMKHIERIAYVHHITILTVPSSVTAEGFYQKLGYSALRDEYYGKERTIIMEKKLC
jgi:histone acetyltransferase (RNA polymerase elongator complex component)